MSEPVADTSKDKPMPQREIEESPPDNQRLTGTDRRNVDQQDRRVKPADTGQTAARRSTGRRQHERGPPAEQPASGSEGDGQGPYNRGGQFEATEADGDTPATQVSRGAHKRNPEDWQDEASNPAKPSSDEK